MAQHALNMIWRRLVVASCVRRYYCGLTRWCGVSFRKRRRIDLAPWQVRSLEGIILLYLVLMPVWRDTPLLWPGLIFLLYWHRAPGYSDHLGQQLLGGGMVLALGALLSGGGRHTLATLGMYESSLLSAWLIGRSFTPKFCRRILHWLLGTSVLWMTAGWVQQWSGVPTPPGWLGAEQAARIAVRSYAVFGNPNIYALYLASIISLALGWSRTAISWARQLACWLILILALGSLYFTYSRNGWLVAAVMCLWQLRQVKTPRLMGLLYGAIGLFLLTGDGFQARVFSALIGQDSSIVYRWHIWQSVGKLLQDNWLWGGGPGNFNPNYLGLAPDTPFSWHAHSFYLQFWLEFGIVPLLLGVVWSGRMVIRELRCADDPARQAVTLGILSLMFGGLFESWQVSRFCREYGSLLVGMLLALQHKEQELDD